MNRTWNFTKKDVINADITKALQELKGTEVEITGIALTEGVDNETGEVRNVALFKSEEYGIISSISSTVMRMVPQIIDYVEEEDLSSVTIKVLSGVSKEGNEFIHIKLV